MPASVKHGGAWKSLTALHVKSGGTWKEALAGYVKNGGAWKQFYAKSAGVTPFTISGFSPASPVFRTRVGTGIIGSGSIAVQLANGSGSFSYSWSVVANSAGGAFSGGTTSASVLFNTGSSGAPNTAQTTLRVTVTDTGDSNRQQTADCVIDWEWA